MANTRLLKELKALDGKDYVTSGVKASPVGGSTTHLIGTLRGPKDTPYEGGEWTIDIVLPNSYPFDPPKMKFTTQIWHPNVSSQTGAICLDILKDQWSPALTVKTAMLSLQALLSTPEPNDPQDAEVASQYKRDRKAWEATAKYWTQCYATKKEEATGGLPHGAANPAEAAKLDSLLGMGFEAGPALRALRVKGGNLEQAVDYLFSTT